MARLRLPNLHGMGFTLAVVAAVAASMTWPWLFNRWGSFETKNLIVPLIQLIMFGMGTTLSVADFGRVMRMPWAVFVGIFLQYLIMPFVAWGLSRAFGFDGQVAAGMILVGSCPGGVASNVINYLAGANVPLSVTMTAISTIMPQKLTGTMVDILKMILLPVAAGLVVNRLLHGRERIRDAVLPALSMGGIVLIIAIITSLSRDKLLEVAPLLLIAVSLHNGLGYLFGYYGARAMRLSKRDARTVAVEVGLQNGGMASGLAISALKSAEAGLAAAIFGPFQNASGSVLASFWRRRPVD